jgi:N-acylneuraminate cytidylyltransferase
MSVIAFIPARGGSKSIPGKNIKSFCGKPLIYWTLYSLQESDVEKIVVATDSDNIKVVVESFNFSKVMVYDRNSKNAQDTSSSESVMLEYINSSDISGSNIFMLVQATSPFTQAIHFNEGLSLLKNYESILSCCNSKKFTWKENGESLNYDIYNRPRRQDYKGNLVENGAFYISSVSNIIETGNRISGKIGIYHMPAYTLAEIDEIEDWVLAECLMNRFVLNQKKKRFFKD